MKSSRKRLYAVITAMVVILMAVSAAFMMNDNSENRGRDYTQRARESYLAGDYDNALLYLRKAMRAGDSTENRMLMADCYEAMGNYSKAIEILRELNTGDPAIASRIQTLEQKREEQQSTETVEVAGVSVERTLKEIQLDSCGITDEQMEDIAELYALNSLSLADNEITDISALAKLRGLDELNLAGNQVTDISPLAELKELRSLNLNGNPISDITILKRLSCLTTLRVMNTGLSPEELMGLAESLPQCAICYGVDDDEMIIIGSHQFRADVTELNLSGLGIYSLDVLKDCTEIKALNLADNHISNLQELMMLSDLERLDISRNTVSDLRPLIGLPLLRELIAPDNLITETSVAGSITGLRSLDLSGNPINEYSGLGQLERLTDLKLRRCGLTDAGIEELQALKRLERLDILENPGLSNRAIGALRSSLTGCSINCADLIYDVDFCGHQVLSNETVLAFPSSGIESVTGLDQLTMLEELDLSGNQISVLYPFQIAASREKLIRLNLANNQIRNLESLYVLTSLRYLDLRGNPLQEAQIIALRQKLPNCEVLF